MLLRRETTHVNPIPNIAPLVLPPSTTARSHSGPPALTPLSPLPPLPTPAPLTVARWAVAAALAVPVEEACTPTARGASGRSRGWRRVRTATRTTPPPCRGWVPGEYGVYCCELLWSCCIQGLHYFLRHFRFVNSFITVCQPYLTEHSTSLFANPTIATARRPPGRTRRRTTGRSTTAAPPRPHPLPPPTWPFPPPRPALTPSGAATTPLAPA